VKEDSESLMCIIIDILTIKTGSERSLLQKSEHDTAVEKEQEKEEGRETMMRNNQKAKEREVIQNDQDGVREPETFDIS